VALFAWPLLFSNDFVWLNHWIAFVNGRKNPADASKDNWN